MFGQTLINFRVLRKGKVAVKSIKTKLLKELEKESPDLRVIAELSDRLVAENQDSVRFTVDASHVNRLGLELVAKQETALSEIIKNAYDADATTVKIEFKNQDKSGGDLTIIDDGHGMDAQDLKNAWMKLSTSEKINSPTSPKFERKRAGKKGIGRFAVQRLGKKLLLKTEVKGNDYGLMVKFDWDDFSSGKQLSNIWSTVETYPKEKSSSGTQLHIKNLRDKWTDYTISKAWKSVLLLQPPFKIAKTSSDRKDDPGFKVEINGETQQGRKSSYSIQRDFLDHAVAEIYGTVDDKGKAQFRLKSSMFGIDESHIADKEFPLIGAANLETRYFIQNIASASSQTKRLNRELARNYGGIRVYRNGFRVTPYGDPKNDWLSFADLMARRQILFPANNNNFFGHIEISEEDNPLLEETSSREGLVENEAYFELQEFTRSCILWAATRIGEARSLKVSPSQKDYTPPPTKPSDAIKGILKAIRKNEQKDREESNKEENSKQESEKKTDSTEDILEDLLDYSEQYESDVDSKIDEMLEYEGMLRILASLGLTISMFGHELKGAKNGVDKSLLLLEKQIGSDSKTLADLKIANQRVFSLGGYIDELISHQESRELKSRSMLGIIERFVTQFENYTDKYGIQVEYDVIPDFVRTCPVHRSEIDSILFNLLTNSMKALKKANPKKPQILITATYDHIDDDVAFLKIRFEDNGSGISKEHEQRIFNAFFTTTTPNSSDVEGVGTGLGLRIVSDIVENYGGTVCLQKPSLGYSTCFEFSIPAENLNDEERQ